MYLHYDACRYIIVRSKGLDTVSSNHVQVPWTGLVNLLEHISSITYNMPIRILRFGSTCSGANNCKIKSLREKSMRTVKSQAVFVLLLG